MDSDVTIQAVPAMKQPWKAVYLTTLFPGAGNVYAGARSKGIVLVSFAIILDLLLLGGLAAFLSFDDQSRARSGMLTAFISLFFLVPISLYALFDSHKSARKFNDAHSILSDPKAVKKSWLAVFLSAIFPGLGQFYNGQVLKGIAFVIVAAVAAAVEARYFQSFLISFALRLYSLKDAFDSAERRNGSPDRFFHQGEGLLIFITVAMFIHAIPTGQLIREQALKAYKIPAGSMIPTLHIGDHLLIDKRPIVVANLRRGDLVVFPYPEDPEKNFIKRIVALAGDKVQFINGDLYINDELIPKTLIGTKPNQVNAASGAASKIKLFEEELDGHIYGIQYLRDDLASYNAGPFLVPENEVFVLGDNRDNSMDSRFWGGVPRSTIEGKAMKLYWSWDRVEKKVNWERIGQKIL